MNNKYIFYIIYVLVLSILTIFIIKKFNIIYKKLKIKILLLIIVSILFELPLFIGMPIKGIIFTMLSSIVVGLLTLWRGITYRKYLHPEPGDLDIFGKKITDVKNKEENEIGK